VRTICCHFAVAYSAFNFTKLKPRYPQTKAKVSTNLFWCHVKSSLEFSKLLASCQFAVNVTSLLFLNVYSYNFVNSWNLFAFLMLTQFTLDSNDSKLSTSWKQYMQGINLFHMLNIVWLSGSLHISTSSFESLQLFITMKCIRKLNSKISQLFMTEGHLHFITMKEIIQN